MSDLVGRTLGQYEIMAEIGHGGMANVYRAVQRSIGREVAIKILPAQFLQDHAFLERFKREVQVISRLQHPHILPVYDCGEEGGQPYIVMAYLPGGTLADRIRNGTLPLDETARLVGWIAGALDYAHKQGIIHRDLKPSNVLLDQDANPYLADFGIARVAEETAHLTGSGIVGTPAYMAPEMGGPGDLTPLVDVYALGVTLYEMLTGQHPYRAATPVGVLMAHVAEPIPDVRDLRPDLPEAVQAVIRRAMAKKPADRYQSAGEMAADLQAVAAGSALVAPRSQGVSSVLEAPTTDQLLPVPEVRGSGTGIPVSVTGRAREIPRQPVWRRLGLLVWIAAAAIVVVCAVVVIGGLAVGGMYSLFSGGAATATTPWQQTGTASPGGAVLPPTATLPPPTAPPLSPTTTVSPPMGGRIAYVVYENSTHEIYTMNSDGTFQINLTHAAGSDWEPAWSPDGTRIAFSSYRDGNSEIYVMNADGSSPINLTNNLAYDYSPLWSPDGARLAFVSDRDGNSEIYVMNADGSNLTNLTGNPASDNSPTWSPDGSQIAFASDRDGNWEIYVMADDGRSPANLTRNPAGDLRPVWSPDGARIAFDSDRDDNGGELYSMSVVGGDMIRLTDDPAVEYSQTWSPDGTQIAFWSTVRAGAGEIYVVNADGSGLTNVTHNGLDDENPAWSPDGAWIAYSCSRGGNSEICLVRPDGSDQIRLTYSAAIDDHPVWAPTKVTSWDNDRDKENARNETTNLAEPDGADAGDSLHVWWWNLPLLAILYAYPHSHSYAYTHPHPHAHPHRRRHRAHCLSV